MMKLDNALGGAHPRISLSFICIYRETATRSGSAEGKRSPKAALQRGDSTWAYGFDGDAFLRSAPDLYNDFKVPGYLPPQSAGQNENRDIVILGSAGYCEEEGGGVLSVGATRTPNSCVQFIYLSSSSSSGPDWLFTGTGRHGTRWCTAGNAGFCTHQVGAFLVR